MISSQSTTEVEVTVPQIETSFITIFCSDRILLSLLALSDSEFDGDYRMFHPLILRINGAERSLPVEIPAGTHAIELLGEKFLGVGLLIVGYGLQAITSVSIGSTESATAATVARIPGYYEGEGRPEDNPTLLFGAINGARYKDRLNKIRYELSEGIWIQLAS